MISVYLCDSNPKWLAKLQKCILSYQIRQDWILNITYAADSPDSLLNYIEIHRPSSGIYFLEMVFQSSGNGIELGARIRRTDPDATLIFITKHEEYAMDTFRHHLMAFDYIIKNQDTIETQINNTLNCLEKQYLIRQTSKQKKLRIKTDDGYYFLTQKNILYIVSQYGKHKVFIHTVSKIFSVSCSLSKLTEELGNDFLLCHKGCLVNLQHIKEINRQNLTLLLDNNERLSCSTRSWTRLIKLFQ